MFQFMSCGGAAGPVWNSQHLTVLSLIALLTIIGKPAVYRIVPRIRR
jgi:heme exporter protein D